jgi:type III pantothenate kinase
MILAVLIGNSNTRLAWVRGTVISRRRVVKTSLLQRSPSRALARLGRVQGVAIASVVPAATRLATELLSRTTGFRPLLVGPTTRTGLVFRYRRSQLGADRVCAAVGARQLGRGNCIVIDSGTATTVNVITAEGVFAGGVIMPGVDMMLDALARGTAQLPRVKLHAMPPLLGHDTTGGVRVGAFHLLAGGLRHIIDRIEQAAGRRYSVVLTGGRARLLSRAMGRKVIVDPDLALRGLARIYHLNRTAR